jgi:prepilin-type N-terminal cleavage/methylation domain-containing protein
VRTSAHGGADASEERGDAGLTLAELLVTLAIMGIAFVAILSGITTFFRSQSANTTLADLDDSIRSYSEQLVGQPYQSCATSYSVAVPSGFSGSVQVRYWDGALPASFNSTCTADLGVQQLTVTLTNSADGITDSMQVVKTR